MPKALRFFILYFLDFFNKNRNVSFKMFYYTYDIMSINNTLFIIN